MKVTTSKKIEGLSWPLKFHLEMGWRGRNGERKGKDHQETNPSCISPESTYWPTLYLLQPLGSLHSLGFLVRLVITGEKGC